MTPPPYSWPLIDKDAPMSKKTRKMIAFLRLQDLMVKVPSTWNTWSQQDASAFNQACRDVQRYAVTGSLYKMLQAGEIVAVAYGVSMTEIDPKHGEAP